ncbi:MAG TPA: hypothetical protein VK843_04545 [Planctomycetota bacterium]|nr:hypothetical protein [Planctomycetota bacterium]
MHTNSFAGRTRWQRVSGSKRAALLGLLLALSGCATVNPGKRFGDIQLDSLKSSYVVRHAKSTRDIDLFIQESLVERGVVATAGPIENKPSDVDFYVEYVDRWSWDVSMFLSALTIQFKSTADGSLIATGSFEQGALHSFPDPKRTVRAVIEQMYAAK